ncbi:MAG: DUF6350 family protein [Actinomycetaceae bacterium]|nr:DUF6350 family protein [Actinomycetaceae bacterium]
MVTQHKSSDISAPLAAFASRKRQSRSARDFASSTGSTKKRPTIEIQLPYGFGRTLLAGAASAVFPWVVVVGLVSGVFITAQSNIWLTEATWSSVSAVAASVWASGYGISIVTGIDDHTWIFSLIPLGLTCAYIWVTSALARIWRGHSFTMMWLVVPAHVVTVALLSMTIEHTFVWWKPAIGAAVISTLAVLHGLYHGAAQLRHDIAEPAELTPLTYKEHTTTATSTALSQEHRQSTADFIDEEEEKHLRAQASSPAAANAAIAAARALRRSEYERKKLREQHEGEEMPLRHKIFDRKHFMRHHVEKIKYITLSHTAFHYWDKAIEANETEREIGIDRDQRTVSIGARSLVIPGWIVSGLETARTFTILLFWLAFAAIMGSFLFHISAVLRVASDLDSGWLGGLVIVLAHLAFLPNMAAWTLSWMMGPGFFAATDNVITPWSSELGPTPAIPAYAAIPQWSPGAWPIVIIVLISICGGIIMYMSKARVDFFEHIASALIAGVAISMILAGLVWLSGGGIGPGRLTKIGSDPVSILLCALLECAVPLVLVMIIGHPSVRRLCARSRS